MILVRFGQLAVLGVLALAGILGSGMWAYYIAMAAGLKGDAERVLFYGFLLGAVELTSFILLMVFAKQKSREFENMTNLVRYGGSIPDERLDGFGSFGVQVKSMIKELADSSDRKSLRIASLTGLVRAVVELTDRSILIIGLDGRIVAASEALVGLPAFSELRVGISSIKEFLPEVELRSILEETDRSHGIVERQEHVSFIPVYSINGEITHFLVDITKKGALKAIAELLRAKPPSNGRTAGEDTAHRVEPGKGRGFRALFSRAKPQPGATK
ncbi:MAG: hypothetical protein A3J97_13945 [Spirochaetes bacterium RIFOXYC1_FULL_54_7]|nr:MAG: hypothetical protein A3J97_13945 [Spirochaetes bacterium RIFOXYC1_FULL_54_7]